MIRDPGSCPCRRRKEQHMIDLSQCWRISLTAALFAASLIPARPAEADPPPWAPAHGWRAKHHHDDDDAGPRRVYVMPYGLSERTCHRDLIGAAIGGAAGGLAGNQIGKGNGRTAATIGGVVI